MALAPWPDAQKAAFLNRQFDLQRPHYRTYYSDLLRRGIPGVAIDGRRYPHRGKEFFLLMNICLLSEAG